MLNRFRYNGNVFLVRSDIKKEGDTYYYDHKLSSIENVKDFLDAGTELTRSGNTSESPYNIEDKRLLSLLQGFSQVLDENGEPLVVYHGTDSSFDVFDSSKSRANMDIQGNFFSTLAEEAEGYGENVRAFFLNIKNPASEDIAYNALSKFKGLNNAGKKSEHQRCCSSISFPTVDRNKNKQPYQ